MFLICRCWFLVAFGFLWSVEVKIQIVLSKGCSYYIVYFSLPKLRWNCNTYNKTVSINFEQALTVHAFEYLKSRFDWIQTVIFKNSRI